MKDLKVLANIVLLVVGYYGYLAYEFVRESAVSVYDYLTGPKDDNGNGRGIFG